MKTSDIRGFDNKTNHPMSNNNNSPANVNEARPNSNKVDIKPTGNNIILTKYEAALKPRHFLWLTTEIYVASKTFVAPLRSSIACVDFKCCKTMLSCLARNLNFSGISKTNESDELIADFVESPSVEYGIHVKLLLTNI